MARVIEKLEEDWVDYVPDVDDNRTDESPVTVELYPLSVEQLRSYQRAAANESKTATSRGQKVIERILSDRVRNVRNYVVFGKVITNGAELFKHGEQAISDNVFDALVNISTLKAGLRKKSVSQSDSSPRVTVQPGNGHALAARVTPEATESVGFGTATKTQIQA